MTDYAFYTDNQSFGPLDGSTMARYNAYTEGWVATFTLVADQVPEGGDDGQLAAPPYNAFAYNDADSSGLNPVIDSGEAMVHGSPLARDDQTTSITLQDNLAGQTVYVGYEPLTNNEVVVGLDSAFSADARRIPIYDFEASGGAIVTPPTDRRVLDAVVDVRNNRYEDASGNFSFGGETTITAPNTQLTLQDSDSGAGGHRIDSDGDTYYVTLVDGSGNVVEVQERIDPDGTVNHLNGAHSHSTLLADHGISTSINQVLTMEDGNRFGSLSMPLHDLPAGNRARDIIFSSQIYDNIRIIRTSVSNASGNLPTDVSLEFKDDDGLQAYNQTINRDVGTYDNPIHSMGGLGFVRVEINNNSTSQHIMQCECHYILE